MKFVKKCLYTIVSNIFLAFKWIGGLHIKWSVVNAISPLCHLNTRSKGKIRLGHKCVVRGGSEISSTNASITIDNNVFINRNCMLVAHNKIVLEEGVTIGPGVYIYDHDHDGNGGYVSEPIFIKKNAWIGAGAIILKGVEIGEGAVVAAGAVVTKNVESHTIVGGIPAKKINK